MEIKDIETMLRLKSEQGLDISELIENSVGDVEIIYNFFKTNNILNVKQEFMFEVYFKKINEYKMLTDKITAINYLKHLVGEELFINKCSIIISEYPLFTLRFNTYYGLLIYKMDSVNLVNIPVSVDSRKKLLFSIVDNYYERYEDDFLFRFSTVFEDMLLEFTSWSLITGKISQDKFNKWFSDFQNNRNNSYSLLYFYKGTNNISENYIAFDIFMEFLSCNDFCLIKFLIKYSEYTSKYFYLT